MTKYEIGDKLRIRQWEDMVAEFGFDLDGNIACRFKFTPSMRRLCGSEFTVCRIDSIGDAASYWSEEGVGNDLAISADMLEPVPESNPLNVATKTTNKISIFRIKEDIYVCDTN